MGGSSSKHSKLFDRLFKNSIELIRESANSEQMDHVLAMTMDGDTTAIEALKEEQEARQADVNRGVVVQLWDEFDVDGDGILSAAENRLLVRQYLEASKVHLPRLLEESLRISLDLGLQLMESMDPDMASEMRREMKSVWKRVKKQLVEQVTLIVDEMLESSDHVADSLLEQMDVNSDGQVDRDEFLSCFLAATSSLLKPERFQAATQQILTTTVG